MADFAGSSNLASLNGNFKEVYADKIGALIPEGLKFTKLVPFSPKEKELGNKYHQPVILGHEHGVTFATSAQGAFALNNAVAGQIKDATVDAQQLLLRSVIGYNVAARASKGRNAFIDSTQFLVENMVKSVAKKLEIELIYGSMGLATAASLSGQVITITTAEWAPGIWAGSENMVIDVYVGSTGSVRQAGLVISSVDMTARTLTVTGTTTGIVSGDTIYFAGAYGNEMNGLHSILSNAGSMFGISAATYSLWKTPSYNASGALSLTVVQKAVAKAVEKGLDEDVKVMVNVNAWTNLLTDEAALVKHEDSANSGKSYERGAESIKFYGQNGIVEIIPSIYVKEGYAFVFAPKMFKRIGSTDVTFKVPGRDDEFFLHLQSNAGYELRCFTEQALFCEAPGKQCLITGVVNA